MFEADSKTIKTDCNSLDLGMRKVLLWCSDFIDWWKEKFSSQINDIIIVKGKKMSRNRIGLTRTIFMTMVLTH